MVTIRSSQPADAPALLAIWRSAVAATHDFIDPSDLAEIDEQVASYVADARLLVAVDGDDRPLGWMGVTGTHVDALFVAADAHGCGIGRRLLAEVAVESVDVNEANAGAIGFYQRLGFRTVGRSPTDDAGRPYPLLHLRRAISPIS
jgi:putative acetyltransferase